MKKYKRIELTVEAQQYFPYTKIDIDGFRNIVEKVLDKDTMQEKQVVVAGEIRRNDSALTLNPGDWVLVLPNGNIQVRQDHEFSSDFQELGVKRATTTKS